MTSVFGLYKGMLAELGVPLTSATIILDWGCGAGAVVAEGRAAGYQVIGCDFQASGPHLSAIDSINYRLPYDDATIDVIVSASVLEHVMDYETSLRELQRVLKPGGAFLHLFPSRGTPIEPHVFVPGATVLRARAWLMLWAMLGVRNQFQRGMSATATAQTNYRWLREHTNYKSRRQIVQQLSARFTDVRFVEGIMLRHTARGRRLAGWPLVPALYSTFRNRAVFGRAKNPLTRAADVPR